MSTISSPIDRLRELGGELFLSGDKIGFRIPDSPEACELLAEIRKDRAAVLAMLQEQGSLPPTLEELQAALPPGVTLLSYQPKEAPFAVAPISIVADAGRFYRSYLRDLKLRLERPEGYHCPSLVDILSKLADAGLELQVGDRGAFVNAHGLMVSDEDLPDGF